MVDLAGETAVSQRLNVSTDLLPGRGAQAVFGQRLAVSVSVEADVWRGLATRRPLPIAVKQMSVVSTSAADLFPSSGATLVVVGFIDQEGDWRMSDMLPLNGLTPVPVTYKPADGILGDRSRLPALPTPPGAGSVDAMIFRVQDAFVATAAGATEAAPFATNVGSIEVQDGANTVFEVIPPAAGRSRSTAFHVPRNCTAKLTYSPAGTERGLATMFIALTFGLGTAWQEIPIAGVNNVMALFNFDSAVTPIFERSDIQGRFRAETNNIDVMWIMQFRIQRNS